MIQYLIVDDEPIAHRIIETYCQELPHMVKKGNCYNAFEAMQFLNEHKVDVLFLDINMPRLSGFEFLKTLSNPPKIIVTTAYKEFALEGYELNISDYLLKPFSFERFIKAVNKTVASLKENRPVVLTPKAEPSPVASSFFIKGDKKRYQVHFEDILFVEAFGHYCKVYLKNEVIVSNENISSLEQVLPEVQFIRTHKSFIVSKHQIKQIEGNRIVIAGHTIPIGQTFKANVNKLF